MALPSLKRKVTIARPKRGRHGVFSELGDDGLEELKPSLFSEASTWSHTSWTSALSSQPRSMGPFDPEETAEMELAPKGWARKIRPIDPRTNDVNRLRGDEEELAIAKRALRGVKPGDWQGHAFAHYRKKLKDEGRWLALPGLVDLVRRTSEEALKAGSYCLPNNKTAEVRLSQKPTVRWVSMETSVEAEPCSGLAPPPLVVSHKTPLEAAGALGQHFKGHPVIVTFEASEFERSDEKKGQLVEGEARGVAQHEMFVCSNFVFSSHAATHLCAKTRQSPQERLCSSHDPAVVVADDVMLFRGPAEGGFPFLPQEDQVPMKVLVTGRAVKRPWLQKGELFLNQDDFLAFSHRLNLMTYQALEDFGPTSSTAASVPPVLVLSACGLADPEHRQPRGGIAQALKTWRTMWSGYFEAVVVACGDVETAAIIDRTVNTDVYMKVLQSQPLSPSAKEWHWKLELMQLSYNPVFANIARRVASVREAPVSRSGSLRPEQPRKSGRRTSGAGIMFLTEAMSENQRPAGAVLHSASSRLSLVEPSEPGESLSIASLSRSMMIGKSLTSAASHVDPESREPSFMTRNGSMLMTSAATTGGSRSARRASLAVGKGGQPEDSRAQMERIAKLRMEHTDHEQQLKDEEDKRNQAKMAEILAKAWGVAGKRMSGIVSKVEKKEDKKDKDKDKKKLQGRLGNKEAEREAQEEKKAKLETMTLDKKRQIDTAAAVLGCPVDLRNYIFKQIEKEIKLNANAAKEQDEDELLEDLVAPDLNASVLKDGPSPGTEEVSAVFEEVRLLAESIEKLLEPRWKDLHGGSYSARTPRKMPGASGALPAIRPAA